MTRQFEMIIRGLRYDTKTATEICTYQSDAARGDFNFEETVLYRTPRGRFFLAGHGGPATRWANRTQSGWTRGQGLTPISLQEARSFAETHADVDTIEKFFEIEEA